MMKDELGGKVTLRPKMSSDLTDNGCVKVKAKGTKKYVIIWKIRFEDYKKCLENNKTTLRFNKGSEVSCKMYS